MHSFTHSLAHRAPPASRTRGRWQPYAALQSASASSSSSFPARASPAIYLNSTPATSVSSSPAHKTPACDIDPSRLAVPSKDGGNRTKYALTLVDQSVKTLCDIWRPQDVPAAYSSPKPAFGTSDSLHPAFSSQRLAKGPVSSSSLLTQSVLTVSPPSVPTAPVLLQPGTSDVPSPLVPVRGFVHEVLRRSRTSGGVLQTALCYLEAIRPKLADLIQREKEGTALRGEPEPTSSITPATEAELAFEAELAKAELDAPCFPMNDTIDTVKIEDDSHLASPYMQTDPLEIPELPAPSPPKPTTTELTPLPLLPSPLLCPRRAFLAALILASKFTQDKCYSNRAWAKLSGLSPREIGRCERALGDALDWRLWVGKAAVPAVPASQKPVSRTQSEPSILVTPPSPISSAVPVNTGLRRSSTLPADALTPSAHLSAEKTDRSYSDYAMYLQPSTSKQDISGSSPLSDVPSLTYSPSSTESSSSGERTIQMSTFLEDNMVPPGGESTQSWPWLESDNVSSSPVAQINGKLLNGNGLQAFQSKTHGAMLWNSSGSFGDLSAVPSFGNSVHILDPTSQPTVSDIPSMG